MKIRFGAVLPVIALAGVLGAGLAFGDSTADQQITARQAAMKANGQALGTLVNMVRGTQPYDAAAVTAAVTAMKTAEATAEAAKGWDVSAQGGTVETRALPAIWSNPDGFTAAWTQFNTALDAVAATTDEAGFKVAFPQLGAACKNCHDQFRGG